MEARKEKGLTQAELEAISGVKQTFITVLLTGLWALPTLVTYYCKTQIKNKNLNLFSAISSADWVVGIAHFR